MNKKAIYSVTTILIMVITSRFLIRVVDATVQIDEDIGLLIILLIVLNTAIGTAGYRLYKRSVQSRKQ
ncbi:MAG: hypothetical protein IJJ30_05305 [Erysipelotrichaceae bacterium]|nr:hypothetical protein [Erysipelotrichaceae bacterium]